MALTTCLECKKEISDEAGKCPHCGKPQTKKSTKNILVGIIIFFILIFAIPAMFRHNETSSVPAKTVDSTPDRDYYKLENGTMIFTNVLDINRFVELTRSGNIATEYFNDLLRQKLATQTNGELIVYIFDKYSTGVVTYYRVKLKNGGIVKFTNTYTGYNSSINFKDGDIVGWVFDSALKEIKQK